MNPRRLLLLALVLLLAALLWHFGNADALSFASLKAQREELLLRVQADPWKSRAIFFAVYFIISASALPGTGPLSVMAGAIFGTAWGMLLASCAGALGACLCFLLARYFLRDWVLARFGERLRWLKQESRNETLSLASMRFIPFIPFFIVNILMSVGSMSLARFWWVTQLSMLPLLFLYVNAGQEIARLANVQEVLEPRFLAALFALALFPWLARMALRRRQVP